MTPLLIPNRVPVVLLRTLFTFAPTSDQVDETVHIKQGRVSLCCNQRPSVARLHVTDLIEIGIDFLVGCPAVDCINLARRSDDAFGL